MFLNIKEAARLLNVSENRIRGYISSGRLSVQRKGKQLLVSQSQLESLLDTGQNPENQASPADPSHPSGPNAGESGGAILPSREELLNLILSRLTALEVEIIEKWQVFAENQKLQRQLRELDQELAARKLEIEKLRRDLVYQKRLCEKEIEDHRLAQQEKWALMEKENTDRMVRERERLEQRLTEERNTWSEKLTQEQERLEQKLIEERNTWSEKLMQEQERIAQRLAAMRDQEGFWSRLMKMITWS